MTWIERESLVAPGHPPCRDEVSGTHWLVYDRSQSVAGENQGRGRLVAWTCAAPAEDSRFGEHSRFPESVLKETIVSTRSTVHPDYRGQNLFPLLVYLGAREGRLDGRKWAAAFVAPELESSITRIMGARHLANVAPFHPPDAPTPEFTVRAFAADVQELMLRCFAALPEMLRTVLRRALFAEEIVETVKKGVARFYEGLWFQVLRRGELTRWRYYFTLANMHLYVRWSTRMLATTAGLTQDTELRAHYLSHLQDEIDHEVSLEKDIAALGFDLEFVRRHMTPMEDVRAYNAVHEALCTGLQRDPTLFLAVPFAMEALTAFAPPIVSNELPDAIASWGVNPAEAMTFIRAHVESDGGGVGHWERIRKLLPTYIRTERQLQEFLSIIRLVHGALTRAFTSFVAVPDIFAAPSSSDGGAVEVPVSADFRS